MPSTLLSLIDTVLSALQYFLPDGAPTWVVIVVTLAILCAAFATIRRSRQAKPSTDKKKTLQVVHATDSSNITIGSISGRGYDEVDVVKAVRSDGIRIGDVDIARPSESLAKLGGTPRRSNPK